MESGEPPAVTSDIAARRIWGHHAPPKLGDEGLAAISLLMLLSTRGGRTLHVHENVRRKLVRVLTGPMTLRAKGPLLSGCCTRLNKRPGAHRLHKPDSQLRRPGPPTLEGKELLSRAGDNSGAP